METVAATDTSTSTSDTDTGDATTAEPMPGSLDCDALELSEPIVIDDYFGGTYVYKTADGAFVRKIKPSLFPDEMAITCDETCTTGVVTGKQNVPMFMWQIDMATGSLVGDPIQISKNGDYTHSPALLIWRGADDILAAMVPYIFQVGTWFRTNTLGLGVGPNGQEHEITVTGEHFEPWWVATDDGYAVVQTYYPLTNPLLPDDFTGMCVSLYNLGFDGTIRELKGLSDGPVHSPRIAYKAGRLAITYVKLTQDETLDSRRLMFASCP